MYLGMATLLSLLSVGLYVRSAYPGRRRVSVPGPVEMSPVGVALPRPSSPGTDRLRTVRLRELTRMPQPARWRAVCMMLREGMIDEREAHELMEVCS